VELPVESDHIEEKKGCTEPVVTEDDIDKAWLELSDDARALSVLGAEGLELVHELEVSLRVDGEFVMWDEGEVGTTDGREELLVDLPDGLGLDRLERELTPTMGTWAFVVRSFRIDTGNSVASRGVERHFHVDVSGNTHLHTSSGSLRDAVVDREHEGRFSGEGDRWYISYRSPPLVRRSEPVVDTGREVLP